MKTLTAFAVALCACSCLVTAQNRLTGTGVPASSVNQKAVWQPGMSVMQMMKEKCAAASDFGDCFAAEMRKSGASAQAVAFTRLTGNTGYMRDFREAGRVDVAYVNYPFRANENQGCLLVNGDPRAVDVDDLTALPQDDMLGSQVYAALAKKHPNAALFPGDRNGTDYPKVERLSGGGQRFIINYRLLDGCHACALIGDARFAFDFDSGGKLTGRKFLDAARAGK